VYEYFSFLVPVYQMQLVSGSVSLRGRVAYVGQEPWIFNGTARENITFGQQYNKERYVRDQRKLWVTVSVGYAAVNIQ
jgi:ABC-type transport system involved in cytochrome bd biosynthesis fused ATPase/permease subunit